MLYIGRAEAGGRCRRVRLRGSEFLRRAGLPRSARRPVATSAAGGPFSLGGTHDGAPFYEWGGILTGPRVPPPPPELPAGFLSTDNHARSRDQVVTDRTIRRTER